MDTPLAHDLMLLAYDDHTGQPLVDSTRLGALVGAAVLVDLIGMEALTLDDAAEKPGQRRVRATGNPVGDPTLAMIVKEVDGLKTSRAVRRLATQVWWGEHKRNLPQALLDDLVATGDLQRVDDPVLGFIPRVRWLPTPTNGEAALRERLRGALHAPFGPDPRMATLAVLLDGGQLLPKVLPDEDKAFLKRRGKELAEGEWLAKGIRDAIQEVQAATVVTAVAAVSS